MNRTPIVMAMVSALLLAACGKLEPVQPIESVESLVANPDRLKELRAQCKADHAKVGDAQCNAVAEATRQRFMRELQLLFDLAPEVDLARHLHGAAGELVAHRQHGFDERAHGA